MDRSCSWGRFFCFFLLDRPLRNGQSFTFCAPGEAPLAATYHPGTRNAGVMLLSGFGADQVMMRAIAAEYARDGMHGMTFDYPGQGLTGSGLGFDNAATDHLPNLTQRAMQVFMQKSGLDARQIIWVGHSLGARVALQSSVLGPLRPAGLVLMGAQINLGYNAQSEFFIGGSDADLPWVQALDSRTPPVTILLVSGTWEDILTVDAATLLMHKLCPAQNTAIPNRGCYSTFPRTWLLFDNLVHNYEVYSPRVIRASLEWRAFQWELPDLPNHAAGAGWRIAAWSIAACGRFTTLGGLLPLARAHHPDSPGDYGIHIHNPGRWLWGKALLWLAARLWRSS